MSEERVIKKYANRRLYDTETSRYITLSDIEKLIQEDTVFCVVDAKSNKDITRSILLQIIAEQEHHNDQPIFSQDMLLNLIFLHGESMQSMIATYLQKSLEVFLDQQRSMQTQLGSSVFETPLHFWKDLAEKNFHDWRQFQGKLSDAVNVSEAKPSTDEK